MDYDSPTFSKAMTYWENGEPLPLDLFAELLAEGYDVQELEAQYLNDTI